MPIIVWLGTKLMKTYIKKVVSISCVAAMVASLSCGVASAAFRGEVAAQAGNAAITDTSVTLTPNQSAAKQIMVAFYDDDSCLKMKNIALLTANDNGEVTLGATGAYKLFFLDGNHNPLEITARHTTISVDYNVPTKGIKISEADGRDYSINDNFKTVLESLVTSPKGDEASTVLIEGNQQMLENVNSITGSDFVGSNGEILDYQYNGETVNFAAYLEENWDVLFNRFEGAVDANDTYYLKFKSDMAFENFIRKDADGKYYLMYSATDTGSYTAGACASYMANLERAILLDVYDVAANSAPAAGKDENAVIDRVASILAEYVTGTSYSEAIQTNDGDIAVTAKYAEFAKLFREKKGDVTVIEAMETLNADRFAFNRENISASDISSIVDRLEKRTGKTVPAAIRDMIEKLPEQSCSIVIDFDTAMDA